MTYTVEALGEVKEYPGKYGAMKSYKVKFKESDNWVEISQKVTTSPPAVGSTMEGTIDLSGPYGPKFKKDFQPKGIAPARGPKSEFDNFTMYLSYAKDIAVALIARDISPTLPEFNEMFSAALETIVKGGKAMYARRPGAPAPESHPAQGDTGPDQDPIHTEDLDPGAEPNG